MPAWIEEFKIRPCYLVSVDTQTTAEKYVLPRGQCEERFHDLHRHSVRSLHRELLDPTYLPRLVSNWFSWYRNVGRKAHLYDYQNE